MIEIENSRGERVDPGFVEFGRQTGYILSPKIIECDVATIPNRSEVQAICDEFGSAEEIEQALTRL